MIPAVRWGNRKGQHPEVLALRLSPPRDTLSRSCFIKLGAPRSFSCPATRQRYSARRPCTTDNCGPEEQAASLSNCGSWPWTGPAHLRRWCCSLVPVEEVTAHPPLGSPRYARGRPLFHCGEETSSHIPPEKRGQMEMLIRDFFSNIFSWPRSRTGRNYGQRFCPRPRPEQSPDSSCRE